MHAKWQLRVVVWDSNFCCPSERYREQRPRVVIRLYALCILPESFFLAAWLLFGGVVSLLGRERLLALIFFLAAPICFLSSSFAASRSRMRRNASSLSACSFSTTFSVTSGAEKAMVWTTALCDDEEAETDDKHRRN